MPKQQKKKIVQLENNQILVPGRMKCDCQAQLHQLINNCVTCGRIVCGQEGVGPCFFCGSKVQSKTDENHLQTDSELMFPDLDHADQHAKMNAVKHKDKLLDYSRRDIHQSQVFDDQTDYYQIADNVWESSHIRDEAVKNLLRKQQQIEEESSGINLQFDLASGQLIGKEAQKLNDDKFRDEARNFQQQKEMEEYKERHKKKNDGGELTNQIVYDDRIVSNSQTLEVYEQLKNTFKSQPSKPKQVPPILSCKVQNDDFYASFQAEVMQSMNRNVTHSNNEQAPQEDYDHEFFDLKETDQGMCLSMLQPWASLLVEGFKRVEGRQWTTSYRGPLWIHAGATPPEPEVVSRVEYQYEELYRGCKGRPSLPSRYPTGALIGVVDFIGVLTKVEYENLRRKGGNIGVKTHIYSRYKFVVRNPRKMFYPISMRGNKDIYKVDADLHDKAQQLLQKVPTAWVEYAVDANIFGEEEKI